MPLTAHVNKTFAVDIALRLFLFCIYAVFQVTPPFKRIIHEEELWMYKNPVTDSFCPMNILWELVIVIPSTAIFINYLINKDKTDVVQGFLAFSLIIGLNGALTNILKVIVGRPRPDFFFRCFPDGNGDLKMECTGNIDQVNDGRKSFPSGHSSVSFACLGFLSLYLSAKLHVFTPAGKSSTWRLLVIIVPLLAATSIAISRTCDYHHHWQDVLCGSVLGFTICWLCYHHFYPPLTRNDCHIPWATLKNTEKFPQISMYVNSSS